MSNKPSTFDLEGHRGCRGLMPENTIPAFLHAIDLGVTTLELDVVQAGDGRIIVSHEAWFSHEFCRDPQGRDIPESEAQQHNIYRMDYDSIRQYDCGLKPHPRFPQQRKLAATKPSLADMLHACEVHSQSKIRYNIEVKCSPEKVGLFHGEIADFTRSVIDTMREAGVLERSTLQSFDLSCLRVARAAQPDLTLALLVEEEPDAEKMIAELGFVPQKYSPYFKLITPEMVRDLHRRGIALVPWTVNEQEDMKRLIEWGVDGIITDYPDRLLEVVD